jgi:hypothetical protein
VTPSLLTPMHDRAAWPEKTCLDLSSGASGRIIFVGCILASKLIRFFGCVLLGTKLPNVLLFMLYLFKVNDEQKKLI